MKLKHIGAIVIILAIVLGLTVFMIKVKEDAIIQKIVSEKGSCFLDDGTCLHNDRSIAFYIIGWVLSVILLIVGVTLVIYERAVSMMEKNQLDVSKAIENAKKIEKEKDEWGAFLSGFDEDNRKILQAIRDQDGIKQSTLRYKTGISKTQLSLLLKELEEKEIISKKPSGKTNQIFLRKNF